jgi:hypothetical protein
VKTSLEIPDTLVREVRILAAEEGLKLKDIVASSLRQTLEQRKRKQQRSICDLPSFSVGQFYEVAAREDRLESFLHDRGHRY